MSQTQNKADLRGTPDTPMWVKVFGAVVIIMLLLIGIVHLTGHSPMNHALPTHRGKH